MSLKVRKFNAQVRDSTTGNMIPAGLLSSDALGAINTAKNAAVSAVQSQQTTSVNAVTSAGTAAAANFPATAAACDTLAGDFAATYVPDQAYAVGDYCTYQYQLYQCKTAIAVNTDHTFVTSHWNLITVTDTINDQVDDLKTQIGCEAITGWSDYNDKKYINLSASSVTVTDGHIVTSTASNKVRYVEVSVSAGDRFTVTTRGGGSSRAYGFVSATGTILEKANSNITLTNQILTAPSDTAFFVINDMDGDAEAFYGEYIGIKVSRIDHEVAAIVPSEGIEITQDLVWTNTSRIRSDNGNVDYTADCMASQLVDITGISCIKFKAINTVEGNLRSALAFYAADESFISAVQRIDATEGYEFIEVLIPSGAKYVRLAKFKVETSPFRAFVVVSNTVEPNTQITTNKNDIKQLQADNVKPICSKDASKVYIYIPTSNKKYYINYKLIKVDNAAQYARGWRLSEILMRKLDKTGAGNGTIMGTGEWETALAIPHNSSTIYMGLGNHGYEEQVAGGFTLFIDGKEVGEDDVFDDRAFEEIQLVNKLEMLDPRMAENPDTIGYHTRIDTINGVKKTITIENKLEFTNAESIPISQGYLFMASLQRKYPADSNNLMTDQFIDNVDYVLTDCSTDTFDPSNANHGVGEDKPNVTEYKFWGSYFDLWGYAKVLRREVYAPRNDGGTQINQFLPSNSVQNYTNQNKIYMSVCKNGDAIAGDIWRMTTEFFVDCGYDPSV